jgi:hypothetical protein
MLHARGRCAFENPVLGLQPVPAAGGRLRPACQPAASPHTLAIARRDR